MDNRPSPSMNNKPLPVTVKNMNVVCYWNLDLNSNVCKMCQKHLMSATQDEISKKNIANTIVIGKCGCGFHTDCFNAWLKAGHTACPVDNSTWTLETTTSNTVYWNTVT